MKSIIALIWRTCIFRSGPESFPANNTFLFLVIAFNAILTTAVQHLLGEGISLLTALTIAVVGLAGTGALIWIVMALMGLSNRAPQTLTAVYAVDILLTLFSTAILMLQNTVSNSALSLGIFAILVWSLAIYGHIYRRAMDVHIAVGIGIAFFIFLFSVAITQSAIST